MRITDEAHPAPGQHAMGRLDVLCRVVQDRVSLGSFVTLRQAQHEPYTTTIEERKARRCPEHQPHAEDIAVERSGALDILNRDGNLLDPCETELRGGLRGRRHGAS